MEIITNGKKEFPYCNILQCTWLPVCLRDASLCVRFTMNQKKVCMTWLRLFSWPKMKLLTHATRQSKFEVWDNRRTMLQIRYSAGDLSYTENMHNKATGRYYFFMICFISSSDKSSAHFVYSNANGLPKLWQENTVKVFLSALCLYQQS